MKKISFLLPLIGLLSCEKEINIDLETAEPQYVIEGNISNADGPYFVSIFKSVAFSERNDFPPVSGALVVIRSSNNEVDTLKETGSGIYSTTTLQGKVETTYILQIESEGNSFNAQSTIPALTILDSIRFIDFSSPNGENSKAIVPVFQDPIDQANYYRFIQSKTSFRDNSYILFSDFTFNGNVNQRPIFSQDFEMNPGDTLSVEMRSLDPGTFLYFNALSRITGNGPNQVATPTNPPNNIKGTSALGYFSAHTSQSLEAVVPN